MGERLTDGLAALQAANPWLSVFGDDAVDIAARVRRDDVAWRQAAAAGRAARLAAGRDVWNAWALNHLATKASAAGSPALAALWDGVARFELDEGDPQSKADFAAWLFPGDVVLPVRRRSAVALDHAAILGDLVGEGVVLDAELTLERAHIRGGCLLRGATLKRPLRGYGLRVDGALDLTGAALQDDVWLRGRASFGALRARDAVFAGEAAFGEAQVVGPMDAQSAQFAGNAGFDAASFGGIVDFSDARFAKAADFAQAHFSQAPRFDRARFAGALRLEGASFPSAAVEAELASLAALISAKG